MKLVFFSTSWSATNGGVNSINFDLCNALALEGNDVHCFIPPNQQISPNGDIEKSPKIHLLAYDFDQFHKSFKELELALNPLVNEPIIWIGHDVITGGAAILCKSKYNGSSVVFHHMDYSNYHYLKGRINNNKISLQKSVLKQADAVFAVGPRLYKNAKRLREKTQSTYEFIPGIPRDLPISSSRQFDYRIAICGRLDEENDPIKNISSAIKAAHSLLSDLPENRGAINLIGTNSTNSSIHARLGLTKNVAINEFPYITDREEYFKELTDNDILLMPSLKEGFGLVGWEAACLGIPILISKSSGLFEYIEQIELAHLVCSVKMIGVSPVDEKEILISIRSIAGSYSEWIEKAKLLSEKLQQTSWGDVANRLVNLLPGTPNETAANSATAAVETAAHQQPEAKRKNRNRCAREKDLVGGDFSRFEDLLSLSYKKRQVVISATEGRDFSRGSKIKFELWKVYTPREEYFLYIHPNTNIGKTVDRLFQILDNKKIKINNIYVIRKDNSDSNYITKAVAQFSENVSINSYSIRDYIWNFCIEETFKDKNLNRTPYQYIDQSLRHIVDGQISLADSSKNFLLERLLEKPKCAAHLVVAPGGMGKSWLCLSLSEGINQVLEQKRLVILITAETLRKYFADVGLNHIEINSLYELYDVYTKACKTTESYDRSTFELSVLSGNITVIIDGLDELASVLQERFDLHSFLESIYELSSGLNSSQILLTTRDNVQLREIDLADFDIEKYELLGFSDKDWMKYANRRFRDNINKVSLTKKLIKLLSQTELHDSDGRVLPFFLDVVCIILEEDEDKSEVESFSLDIGQNDYPTNNSVTDNIIHAVFRREIRRQGINVGIDILVGLISEVVSENGETFDKTTLKHQLDLYFDTRAAEILRQILVNPLFNCIDNHISLKYGFLSSYFRSLYIINTIINTQFTSESLNSLAKANSNDGPEIDYVRKFFQPRCKDLEKYVFNLMPKLLEVVHTCKDSDTKKSETARRAISGLLKIYVLSNGYSSAQISEKISDLFSTVGGAYKRIDGLNIYGDFPPLDFSGATILNSRFLDYKNFSRSKFKSAKFMYSTFSGCANDGVLDSTILLADFDNSCALGDLEKLIDQVKSKELISAKLIEDDCFHFLGSFFTSGGIFDPKTSWIKFSNRINGLKAKNLPSLIPEYIEIKTIKSDEKYYSLADSFIGSARRFVDNNLMDERLKSFISFVIK